MSFFGTIVAGVENLGKELGLVSDFEKTVAYFKQERANGLSVAKALCNVQMAKDAGQDFLDAASLVLCFITATSEEAMTLKAIVSAVQKAMAAAPAPTVVASPAPAADKGPPIVVPPAPVTIVAGATGEAAQAATSALDGAVKQP